MLKCWDHEVASCVDVYDAVCSEKSSFINLIRFRIAACRVLALSAYLPGNGDFFRQHEVLEHRIESGCRLWFFFAMPAEGASQHALGSRIQRADRSVFGLWFSVAGCLQNHRDPLLSVSARGYLSVRSQSDRFILTGIS